MAFPKEHRAKIHSTDEIDKSFVLDGGMLVWHGQPRGEQRGNGCELRRAA